MSAAGLPLNPSDALPMSDGIGRGRLRRAAPLAALSARTAGGAAVAGLRSKLTGADPAEFHGRTAERYAELLGHSKGALMKAGQMLSMISVGPAVPLEFQSTYQAALARLRDDAPPMAGELAQTVLERELGRKALSAFAEFDWEPLAAASIGQVHAARLRDGREVAVKIQYPGVADAIAADLKNTQLLVTFVTLLGGLYTRRLNADLRDAARDMSARIVEELDYRLEAANQAEFAAHYRGHPFIHVPEVIGELCTDRVLTQELCLGRSWSEALGAEQELRDQWAEAIWRFVYGSYERLGMINADPHPGNYLFHDDGSVSFLDFGCVQRFPREQTEWPGRSCGRACAVTCSGPGARPWRPGSGAPQTPSRPRRCSPGGTSRFATCGRSSGSRHPRVCGELDRTQVLANRTLGERAAIPHDAERLPGMDPDRAGAGVSDRAAARGRALGRHRSRGPGERRAAHRDGQARTSVLRGTRGGKPCLSGQPGSCGGQRSPRRCSWGSASRSRSTCCCANQSSFVNVPWDSIVLICTLDFDAVSR